MSHSSFNWKLRLTMSKDDGFTLIELLSVMVLTSLLLALSAGAVRQYWFVRSLEGGQQEIVTQLRQLQQRTVAESHPRIYGARFPRGAANNSSWGLVRVDVATPPATSTCTQYETRRFDAGVTIFNPGSSGVHTTFQEPGETQLCRNQIVGAANDDFVFFYARGTATAGRVTIQHPVLDRRKIVCVSGLTGRIETQEAAGC